MVESPPVFYVWFTDSLAKSATNIVAAMLEFLARQLVSWKAVPFWKDNGLARLALAARVRKLDDA